MKLHKKTLLAAMAMATLSSVALIPESANAATVLINGNGTETGRVFSFASVPSNSSSDFADQTNGKAFVLLAGTSNAAGSLGDLNDGLAQRDDDEPADSFFATDNNKARVQVDLGATMLIDQINTYSRHTGSRIPQDYKVYGATAPTNIAPNFAAAAFMDDAAFALLGYTLIADVETAGTPGRLHGVSIDGTIGNFRYILFDMDPAAAGTGNGVGTFFGEIDIYALSLAAIPEPTSLALLGLGGLLMGGRRRRIA